MTFVKEKEVKSDKRDDAFVRALGVHRGSVDLWAVWPCGTECSLKETRDLEHLLTWKSDDYQIRAAVSYDETGCPVYG